MSTISTTISTGIYFGTNPSGGTAPYSSPLTITNTGAVLASSAPDSAAVYDSGIGILTNDGTIVGSSNAAGVLLAAGGSVDNTGLISGVFIGVTLNGPGLVTNSGTIVSTGDSNDFSSFRADVSFGDGGTLINSAGGYITGGVGFFNGAGTAFNAGTITNDDGYGIDLRDGGTVTDSGAISGSGSSTPAIYFGGQFYQRYFGATATSSLLNLEGGYSISGTVVGNDISGSTNTVELTGSAAAPVTVNFTPTNFTSFGTVAFAPGDGNYGTLVLAAAADVPGTISGLTGLHDVVELGYISDANNDATVTLTGSDQLIVTGDNGAATLQLDPGESYGAIRFVAVPDGNGTDITVETPCFCRGTRIMTEHGEVAVEALAIGDRLVTRSGEAKALKWIGRRSYVGWLAAGNPKVLPICFAPGSLADGVPKRDLWVSPEHAMYLAGGLVPAGLLVNGRSIVKAERVEEVHYFHLDLGAHDVVIAEGALSESFVDDNSRGMFHNVAEFRTLYPEARTHEPARYCAPRIEDGFALEALRSTLRTRALRLRPDGTAGASALTGCLDHVSRTLISGWAHDPDAPGARLVLTVFANGAEVGQVVADRYRDDLERAGIGDGQHGFELKLPAGLATDTRFEMEVHGADGWVLPAQCATVLEPRPIAGTPGPAVLPPLGTLRGQLDEVGRWRIKGWAQDSADSERHVGLLVIANGKVVAQVLANRYRSDLEAAALGSGRHSFELVIPGGLSAIEAQEVRVCREADGADLPGSPVWLPAAGALDMAVEAQITAALAGVESDDEEDRALSLLSRETERLLARRAARLGGRAAREALQSFRRRWGPDAPGIADPAWNEPSPQALVIDLQVPCATRDAGSVAILSHIRALQQLGYGVGFAASEDMRNADALATFAREEGVTGYGAPHYSGIEDVLIRHAGGFDLVYLHRATNADRYLPLVRRHCPKARVVYSVADLHHLRLARQAQVERRPELLAYSRYFAGIETAAAQRADIVITHSPVEAETLRRVAGFGKVHVVPFAVPLRPQRRSFAERHGVAILGGFEHAPNPDAVYYLIREILPRVWKADPTIGCRIVGHGWQPGRLSGLDARVEVVGAVADLGTAFDTVRLTVAPLRFGAGLKGKVLESFAASLPCVMTPVAAEGLPLRGALPGLVAEDPAALAELILRLHADRAFNERAGNDAARIIEDEFAVNRVVEALREAIGAALPKIDRGPAALLAAG